MNQSSNAPTAIDIFAGMGGLTLGLKRAGFRVVVGVEVDEEVAKTYEENHPEVLLLKEDVRKVHGKDILDAVGLEKVDLIAGCPPCQGFSRLTDKYHREDPRNNLIFEMLRLVKELNPRIVMLENVPGLAVRGKSKLNKFVRTLEILGYVPNYAVLNLANYGVPQSRRRLVLLAGKRFRIEFPEETHSKVGKASGGLKPWLTLKQVIGQMENPVKLSKALKNGGPSKFNWHVVRDLKPLTRRRIKAIKAGESRRYLPKSLRPKCHSESDRGFENVYGRLDWDQLPPTITKGCTTPCMGRFGHPSQIRTISVREAAMLQTFPASYKLKTDFMDAACDMLGNALPPTFAQAVGKACFDALNDRM
jgi:DNA (cytosine-5)-methyltransferase 1